MRAVGVALLPPTAAAPSAAKAAAPLSFKAAAPLAKALPAAARQSAAAEEAAAVVSALPTAAAGSSITAQPPEELEVYVEKPVALVRGTPPLASRIDAALRNHGRWLKPLLLACLGLACALVGGTVVGMSCVACALYHKRRVKQWQKPQLPRIYSDSAVYVPYSEEEDEDELDRHPGFGKRVRLAM